MLHFLGEFMQIFFAITYFVSLAVAFACMAIVSRQKESFMQKIMMLMSFSVFLECTGYFIKVSSVSAEGMLAGSKLIYMCLPYCLFYMLRFVIEYCGYKINSKIKYAMHAVNILLSALAVTMDFHGLFFKSHEEVRIGDMTFLRTVPGPVYYVMVSVCIVYFVAQVAVAGRFTFKNIHDKRRSVISLFSAIIIPIIPYVFSTVMNLDYEYQPLAYAIFMAVLLGLVFYDDLYDVSNVASQYISRISEDALAVFGAKGEYKGCNERAKEIFPILKDVQLNADIKKVSKEFEDFLSGNLNEYMAEETIYDVSVQPIAKERKIIGHVVRLTDVTMDRIYTRLLTEQKKSLESEVETLSDISYRDEMTGLGNRRFYEETLNKLEENDTLSDVTVIALDVNGLKNVNDNIGHSAGDELIKGAAEVIAQVFGHAGEAFRTGGDEFMAIIKDGDCDLNMLEKRLLEVMALWHGENVDKLSISYGFASGADFSGASIKELIEAADSRMYECKKAYYEKNGIERRKA